MQIDWIIHKIVQTKTQNLWLTKKWWKHVYNQLKSLSTPVYIMSERLQSDTHILTQKLGVSAH